MSCDLGCNGAVMLAILGLFRGGYEVNYDGAVMGVAMCHVTWVVTEASVGLLWGLLSWSEGVIFFPLKPTVEDVSQVFALAGDGVCGGLVFCGVFLSVDVLKYNLTSPQ